MEKIIFLSFDVEEFDLPLEYGQKISLAEQLKIGTDGLMEVMNVIEKTNIKSTFFTTANFADHFPAIISKMATSHEIASHTYYHLRFENSDLIKSRERLQEISGQKITGLRMPRMKQVSMQDVKEAGYLYDSSINPTWLPGRYNNFHLPRTDYNQEGIIRVPVSVTPIIRFPLFWLSFKNLPYQFYLSLLRWALKKDGYVCIYFHPWEFVPLDQYSIPAYTKRHSGKVLQARLERLITDLKNIATFKRMDEYILTPTQITEKHIL
ncbi:MAG: polysaccharide deacetylase family protein [Bacteroidetes bacterium]|nr:polysaccharide deacetylase family protein [Bacteroidota bacterium]